MSVKTTVYLPAELKRAVESQAARLGQSEAEVIRRAIAARADELLAEIIHTEREPVVVSPYVVAELDYLVATRVGVDTVTSTCSAR